MNSLKRRTGEARGEKKKEKKSVLVGADVDFCDVLRVLGLAFSLLIGHDVNKLQMWTELKSFCWFHVPGDSKLPRRVIDRDLWVREGQRPGKVVLDTADVEEMEERRWRGRKEEGYET